MILKKRSDCNGCLAKKQSGSTWKCDLGYKIKKENCIIKPVEPCPKPLTYETIRKRHKIIKNSTK